jgi:hypothetical protein
MALQARPHSGEADRFFRAMVGYRGAVDNFPVASPLPSSPSNPAVQPPCHQP